MSVSLLPAPSDHVGLPLPGTMTMLNVMVSPTAKLAIVISEPALKGGVVSFANAVKPPAFTASQPAEASACPPVPMSNPVQIAPKPSARRTATPMCADMDVALIRQQGVSGG